MAVDVGDVYPLTVEIRDANGVLANAGAVTLTITLPDATTVAPPLAISNPSTGVYQADYPTVQAGRHTARWVATGANSSSFADVFDVYDAAPGYIISLADAKAVLRLTASTSDEELRPYIAAATKVIERHRNEVVVRRSITEFYQLYRRSVPTLALRQSPAVSLTSVATVDGFRTWNIGPPGGLHLDPTTGVVSVEYEAWLYGHLQIVYVAGYQVVPEDFQQAAKLIVAHLWSTRRGFSGVPAPGNVATAMPSLGLGFAIPRAAQELLGAGVPGIA